MFECFFSKIRRLRVAYWISKQKHASASARTHTHTQIRNTYYFSTATKIRERTSVLLCLSCLFIPPFVHKCNMSFFSSRLHILPLMHGNWCPLVHFLPHFFLTLYLIVFPVLISICGYSLSNAEKVLIKSLHVMYKTLREECKMKGFENIVLRRIFGPRRDEVTGECRRLHNKEPYALYSSQNIIRVIKSRKMRWAEHVARMGKGEVHTGL